MSEGDHAARQEAKRRLSEPEGDHDLHSALERMKEHHPHLWQALHKVHFSDDADASKLEEWRKAPEGSQEEIWAEHYDEAMGTLAVALR